MGTRAAATATTLPRANPSMASDGVRATSRTGAPPYNAATVSDTPPTAARANSHPRGTPKSPPAAPNASDSAVSTPNSRARVTPSARSRPISARRRRSA